jgi:hypothetical protein
MDEQVDLIHWETLLTIQWQETFSGPAKEYARRLRPRASAIDAPDAGSEAQSR